VDEVVAHLFRREIVEQAQHPDVPVEIEADEELFKAV
jgi:hypothetical protein